MRKKAQILKDTTDTLRMGISHDATRAAHERLTIEILIDIRDVLNERLLEIDRGLDALNLLLGNRP